MGTELMRFIQTKKQLMDPRAQERKAKADRDEHLATSMPPGTTFEQMHEWCDKASSLNDKCQTPRSKARRRPRPSRRRRAPPVARLVDPA